MGPKTGEGNLLEVGRKKEKTLEPGDTEHNALICETSALLRAGTTRQGLGAAPDPICLLSTAYVLESSRLLVIWLRYGVRHRFETTCWNIVGLSLALNQTQLEDISTAPMERRTVASCLRRINERKHSTATSQEKGSVSQGL